MVVEKTLSRLGVNIDHVATLRRLRDTAYPDLLSAAHEAIAGGADQITTHLREDQRHIQHVDVVLLKETLKVDLNLEMAATEAMLSVALKVRPTSICLVPEKREERTTEGGLDFSNPKRNDFLKYLSEKASAVGVVVSFFIEPDSNAVEMSKKLGAHSIEFHTGALCLTHQVGDSVRFQKEYDRLIQALQIAHDCDLIANAGHGIDYKIAPKLGALKEIHEFNIGHSIVCEAIFCGMREATRKMKQALNI